MRLCHPSQLNARVQTTRPPRISTTTFIPSTRHIYVPRPVQYRTSLCLASSSSVYRLVCDFCSSGRDFASSFFQIPPHGGHPCSSLTVPTAKSVVDSHHQVVVHAAHTKKRPPASVERLGAWRRRPAARCSPTLLGVVPSPRGPLTSVFGKGTGVTAPPRPPAGKSTTGSERMKGRDRRGGSAGARRRARRVFR